MFLVIVSKKTLFTLWKTSLTFILFVSMFRD